MVALGMALTLKQQAFAQHFAVNRSGPAAYRHAYNVDGRTKQKTIDTNAAKILADTEVAKEIDRLCENAANASDEAWDLARVFKLWADLATADRNELIGLRIGGCRFCHGDGHGYQWKEREYLEAVRQAEATNSPLPDVAGGFGFRRNAQPHPDCPECDGEGVSRIVAQDTRKLSPAAKLLYGGVKQTARGVEIIIADQTKALENLTRMLGGFKDGVKLDGALGIMAQVVQLQATDPNEAARVYREMIAGKLSHG